MSDYSTPRRMVKAWLQGELPSRVLLMPILFALGARMESLSLHDFQKNPTKVANALRQIRGVLKVDGITCYFDPLLEVEALGCRREWQEDGSCLVAVPAFSTVADLRQQLNSPDSLAHKGLIPVACEILRRTKTMLKDEPALMIRVTGPVSLARQLAASSPDLVGSNSSLPHDLVQFAAEVTAAVSRSFAEAGADVILLAEDLMSELAPDSSEWYPSLLAPVVNIVRFYEALPVLLGRISEEILASLNAKAPDCCLCPAFNVEQLARKQEYAGQELMACALASEAFCQDQQDFEYLLNSWTGLSFKLRLLTSMQDVKPTADIKNLAEGLKCIRDRFSGQPLSGRGLPHPAGSV